MNIYEISILGYLLAFIIGIFSLVQLIILIFIKEKTNGIKELKAWYNE